MVASSGCGGQTVGGDPSLADASSDLASTPEDAAGPDAAPPDLVIGPPIIIVPRPDVDWDGGAYCQKLVVSRERGSTTIACPADAGDAGMVDPRYMRVRACLPAPPIGQSCADIYSDSCILQHLQLRPPVARAVPALRAAARARRYDAATSPPGDAPWGDRSSSPARCASPR